MKMMIGLIMMFGIVVQEAFAEDGHPKLLDQQEVARASKEKVKLWAAISVTEPLVVGDRLQQFVVFFALANDGGTAIDPKDETWRLMVNGREHPDSQFIFSNGPRDQGKSLRPGEHILFTYAMGERFKEPGTYTIIWKGERFESAPVVFRVVAQKKNREASK
jgi:hypothetical protein